MKVSGRAGPPVSGPQPYAVLRWINQLICLQPLVSCLGGFLVNVGGGCDFMGQASRKDSQTQRPPGSVILGRLLHLSGRSFCPVAGRNPVSGTQGGLLKCLRASPGPSSATFPNYFFCLFFLSLSPRALTGERAERPARTSHLDSPTLPSLIQAGVSRLPMCEVRRLRHTGLGPGGCSRGWRASFEFRRCRVQILTASLARTLGQGFHRSEPQFIQLQKGLEKTPPA